MRIHQLNCGTMGGLVPTRVLLVEAPDGLVLVDSGIGLQDIADPAGRLGAMRHALRPALRTGETAVHRIGALGLDPRDVRHIVLTHMDVDHIGGLADFPEAQVHVAAQALTWAVRTPRFVERRRYRRPQWSHGPRFVEYSYGTDRWEGFRAHPLDHVAEGMMLVDLPGHAVGHAGVFVPGGGRGGGGGDHGRVHGNEDDDKDLLHAGDAFYHRGQIGQTGRVPRPIPVMERALALEPGAVSLTHARLAGLARRRHGTLDVVCAHDPSGPGGL
ncbi:MBL fold metallo-hydrolase [Dietzia maris]|uniref:MBL fold metallo-hydrolase n=1 Tax=Dietzia maris TaxID=37915 RepID=UPI00232D28EB|nr:MBL fold metallo-hydrolase [Dietzia maris]